MCYLRQSVSTSSIHISGTTQVVRHTFTTKFQLDEIKMYVLDKEKKTELGIVTEVKHGMYYFVSCDKLVEELSDDIKECIQEYTDELTGDVFKMLWECCTNNTFSFIIPYTLEREKSVTHQKHIFSFALFNTTEK